MKASLNLERISKNSSSDGPRARMASSPSPACPPLPFLLLFLNCSSRNAAAACCNRMMNRSMSSKQWFKMDTYLSFVKDCVNWNQTLYVHIFRMNASQIGEQKKGLGKKQENRIRSHGMVTMIPDEWYPIKNWKMKSLNCYFLLLFFFSELSFLLSLSLSLSLSQLSALPRYLFSFLFRFLNVKYTLFGISKFLFHSLVIERLKKSGLQLVTCSIWKCIFYLISGWSVRSMGSTICMAIGRINGTGCDGP